MSYIGLWLDMMCVCVGVPTGQAVGRRAANVPSCQQSSASWPRGQGHRGQVQVGAGGQTDQGQVREEIELHVHVQRKKNFVLLEQKN